MDDYNRESEQEVVITVPTGLNFVTLCMCCLTGCSTAIKVVVSQRFGLSEIYRAVFICEKFLTEESFQCGCKAINMVH